MLAHNVFFTLKDKSDESVATFVEAARHYLSGHDGVAFFAVGGLNTELDRPVNDQDFQVALHVIFDDKAAHDVYQVHERHLEFIDKNKELWEKVRVFDSDVA